MNSSLQISTKLHETAAFDSSNIKINYSTDQKHKLFGGCFKSICKAKLRNNVIHYNSNDYDYIVEKLIVKYVPIVLLAIPKDVSKSRNSTSMSNGRNNQFTLSTNYNSRFHELSNIMTGLNPNLEKYEKPFEEPWPLKLPINKSTSFRSMKQVSSIKKFVKQKNECQRQKPKTFPLQSLLMENEFGCTTFKNKQKVDHFGQNTYLNKLPKYQICNNKGLCVVQSDQDLFHSLKNVTEFLNKNEPYIQSANYKSKIKSRLNYSHQLLVHELKPPNENIIDNTKLNITLRWKIIVKHYNFN